MSTDLTFLRRRVKHTANAAPAAPAPAEHTSPVPVTDTTVTLTVERPAVRLTRYASGIGTLHITGAASAFLETQDGAAVDLFRQPAASVGNRPLAERTQEGAVLIGLRHLRHIRRIVASGQDMAITTHAGLTVRVHGHADLGIHVVAGHLELRRDSPSADLTDTYALGATA